MESKCKHFTIVNSVDELPILTEVAETLVTDWQLPMSLEMTINLVLEEVVSNIIFYAYSDTQIHQICLDVELKEHSLGITIIDDGIPFDPTQKTLPDTLLATEEREIGGLGILLVHKLMDSVVYKREKNKNILTLNKKIEL